LDADHPSTGVLLPRRYTGQSQGATGALQAAQAGNQLLALQSQQIADLTALLAAQGRAQALEAARVASGEEQAREQLERSLAPGAGYQPGSAQMFHGR
jgi:P-type conjugative transfer protein TrbJ